VGGVGFVGPPKDAWRNEEEDDTVRYPPGEQQRFPSFMRQGPAAGSARTEQFSARLAQLESQKE
jgi:hypothetical protein